MKKTYNDFKHIILVNTLLRYYKRSEEDREKRTGGVIL
jgi:hypothetical protein